MIILKVMKIAFIGQKGIPAISGGVEKQVENLAIELKKKEIDITVYNRQNYYHDSQYKGVKIISLPFVNTKNLANITHVFLATLHSALKLKPEIVHYHSLGPALWIWLHKLLSPKTKVVATLHSFDYLNNKWSGFAKFMLKIGEKTMFKFSDEIIVLNKIIKNYVSIKYNKTVNVIPNGVRISNNRIKDTFLNLEKNSYILSVSRLIELKGVQYLIEAFKKTKTDKKLVIVGDGDYKRKLEDLAMDDKRIVFLGNQTGINLEKLYQNAFLFVQSSETEGLSMSLIEAMSYALPCLVSNISANIDTTKNLAYSFENKNTIDLKEKLEDILKTDLIDLEKKAKELKDIAKEYYDIEKISEKTIEVYNKVNNS